MSFVELADKYGSMINTTYGTDKNTIHSYGPIYECIFTPIKNTATSILEIGFHSGKSLQLYSEYFTNATIYGIDIDDNCFEDVKQIKNIQMVFGDATLPSVIDHFNKKYDVIIEDASHTLEHQIQHFKDYSDFVLPNGYYIIEDVTGINADKLKMVLEPISKAKGFLLEILDLREIKKQYDDILFVFKRSPV